MEFDDELHEDEEEILVYVEFEDFANSNVFNDKDLKLDMIGLDTDHPIMQVNGKFFEGAYEDAIGTCMFFQTDVELPVEDPVFDKPGSVRYFAKTKKVLKMQRVFVQPRTEVFGDSEHPESIPNMNIIQEAGVPTKYQEEAFNFWEKIRDDRINAVSAYLEKQRIREEKRSQGIILDSDSDEDNPFAIYKERLSRNVETSKCVTEDKETDTLKSNIDVNTNDTHCEKTLNDNLIESSESCNETNTTKSKSSTSRDKSKVGKKNRKEQSDNNSKLSDEQEAELITESSNKEEDISQELHTIEKNIKDSNKEIISEDVLDTAMDISNVTNNVISSNNDAQLLDSDVSPKKETGIVQQSKKLEKLKKREAKMEEISQRLKKMAVDACKNK